MQYLAKKSETQALINRLIDDNDINLTTEEKYSVGIIPENQLEQQHKVIFLFGFLLIMF